MTFQQIGGFYVLLFGGGAGEKDGDCDPLRWTGARGANINLTEPIKWLSPASSNINLCGPLQE